MAPKPGSTRRAPPIREEEPEIELGSEIEDPDDVMDMSEQIRVLTAN